MRSPRVSAVAFALATGACASLGRAAFQEPTVSLRNVRVVGLGVTGGDLEVELGVYNPNDYRLDTSRLTYRVFVADSIAVAAGELDRRVTVQAEDSAIVRIPVAFAYAGLGVAARQLMATGSVEYRVTGNVTVATVTGSFTVPFSSTGRYTTAR